MKAIIKILAAGLAVLISGVLGLGMLQGSAAAAPPADSDSVEFVPGELNVRFAGSLSGLIEDEVLEANDLTVVFEKAYLPFKTVKVPRGVSMDAMARRLERLPFVEYAEPNYIDQVLMIPNDPLEPDQWHFDSFASGGMGAESAWDIEEGDPSVIVAVVDTGVAYEDYGAFQRAPDLAQTNFVLPHDSVDGDGHPNDEDGHGTHVTGTIAQSTNNSIGTAGVAHGCSIMPVRNLGPGGGTHAQMADAFNWATNNGAKVINYSGGGSDSQTKRDACQYAYEHGVTICAASGNDSGPIIYPAAYDQWVIAVGATDRTKDLAWYSNFGAQQDVCGTGGDTSYASDGVLQQTFLEGQPTNFVYEEWQGTSMATPHVSATAALFISKTGLSDPDVVRDQLQRTAHDLGAAGRDNNFGWGLIDAYQVLVSPYVLGVVPDSELVGEDVVIDGTNFGAVRGTSTVSFNGTAATAYPSWTDTQITVTVPTGASTGPLTVTRSGFTSNSVTFTVLTEPNPVPTITGTDPVDATAGGSGFTLTVDGTNFIGSSIVRWNGSNRATTYVSPNRLTAAITAGDISTAGSRTVTVFNPAPGGGTSNGATFMVNSPVPTTTGLSPSSAAMGGNGFTLDMYGTNFVSNSVVRWNGADRATTFYDAGHITAQIQASDIATTGPRSVTVFNPAPGGGTSNAQTFDVVNPVPSITGLDPSGATVGGPQFTLTVNGNGFVDDAVVRWNGIDKDTSFVNANQLSAHIPATDIETIGDRTVTVFNPPPGGGLSNGATFTVQAQPNPVPTITGLSPGGATAGGPGFALTVDGGGFVAGATVRWDGLDRATTYVSPNRLVADIPASDIAITGPRNVTVFNPAPGGGTSNDTWFFVNEPEPDPDPDPDPTPPTQPVWYLAEGTTAWGFSTYISILNPNPDAVTAGVTYMTASGPRTRADLLLPAMSQTTINPADDLGEADFSTRVECRDGKTIAVDRTMTWTGAGSSTPEAHSSVGVTSAAGTWYLPEGSTNWGFECFLLVQNPNPDQANVTLTYMIEGEGSRDVVHSVPPNSRATFNMASDIGGKDASIKVSSDVPVIPERAMYRNNRREGHESTGTTTPATDFFLAEGTSAWGFTTYVLVQNPNTDPATVTVTYMAADGARPQPPFTMAPNSRKTLRVNDALPSTDFSTQVHADAPVIAERAMYWGKGNSESCHDSIGMPSPHATFYLPDGQTSQGRETYTLVMNPNPWPVEARVTYLSAGGGSNQRFVTTIPANARLTYSMVDGGIGGRAGILVESLTPGGKIMCERAMYWNSRAAGTDTIGGYSD